MPQHSAFLGACLMFAALSAAAQGRASPFDRVTRSGSYGKMCYRHALYTVVELAVKESVGSDLFVRDALGSRCDADSLPGDFVWRNRGEADYFLGIRGSVLFIDQGTGPDLRGLTLVDLRTRRVLVSTGYVGDVMRGRQSRTVAIWQGAELLEPGKGCPTPPISMPPGVDSLYWVDLRTGKLTFAGRTRCAVRQ